MDRETDDEKADRKRRAGRWLRKERDARRIKQRDMYERLGVAQQTYSQYERGILKIPYEFAAPIAEVLGLEESAVWRGLEMPLPTDFRSDQALKDWARRNWGDVVAEALEEDPPAKPPNPGRKATTDPRTGESVSGQAQVGGNGV